MGGVGHAKSLIGSVLAQEVALWSAIGKTDTDESTERWGDFFKVTQEVTGQDNVRAQLLSRGWTRDD